MITVYTALEMNKMEFHKKVVMEMDADDAFALSTLFYNTTPDQTYSAEWRLALVHVADHLVQKGNDCRGS